MILLMKYSSNWDRSTLTLLQFEQFNGQIRCQLQFRVLYSVHTQANDCCNDQSYFSGGSHSTEIYFHLWRCMYQVFQKHLGFLSCNGENTKEELSLLPFVILPTSIAGSEISGKWKQEMEGELNKTF